MNNLDDYNKAYSAADKLVYTKSQLLTIYFRLSLFVLHGLKSIVVNIFMTLVELVISKKPKSIAGQVALVTGGANGLGREIARCLAKQKCNVAICDLDIENANVTAKEIESEFGVSSRAYKVDVSDYDAVEQLKKNIEADIGFVDILVNNAGIMPLMSLREGKPSDYQKIINVNLTSNFWTCRAFLNGMIKRKRGHIVAISSICAKITMPRAVAYCATKHAVKGFMSALYVELCSDNAEELVRLSTIYPSYINTRKELADHLNDGDPTPRLNPSYVGEQVVEAILYNKMSVVLPKYMGSLMPYMEFIPEESYGRKKVEFFGGLKNMENNGLD